MLFSVFGSLLGAFPVRVWHYLCWPGAEQFPGSPGQRLWLLCMRVPLHVVGVLLCLVFGASWSVFWSVLVFSSAFFRLFFSETICPCSFAFPGDFLVFFLGRIGGILLSPTLLPIRVCWPVRLWFSSSSVSVCLLRVLCSTTGQRTCFRLLHFLGIPWAFQQLLRAHSTSPSNEMAVVMAPVLHQSVPTFIAAFRADSLTARSPAWLFPLLPALFFPALFSFSALHWIPPAHFPRLLVRWVCRLFFFVCVCVSSFTAVSTTPGSYSARLARSIEAPIMATHVFSCLFFTPSRQKFGPSRASGVMFGLSHEPTPAKSILRGDFVGGNWLTHYVYLYPCSWLRGLRAQVILDGKLLVSKKCRLVCGLRVTLPSGRLQRLLMHLVNDEFGPKQFTCTHQLHPLLCHCPLVCPCPSLARRLRLSRPFSAGSGFLVHWVPFDILYLVT